MEAIVEEIFSTLYYSFQNYSFSTFVRILEVVGTVNLPINSHCNSQLCPPLCELVQSLSTVL